VHHLGVDGDREGTGSDGVAQVDAAARWLWSDDGLAAARAALRRARLPVGSHCGEGIVVEHDLVADAFLRFRDRVARLGPLDDLNVAAYLTRVLQHLVADILRARPSFGTEPFDDELGGLPQPATDLAGEEAFAGEARAATLRSAIEAADATRWERAAALAFVTAVAHPDAVPPDHPAPRAKRGASEREQAMWHALWFAGRRDGLFAVDGHEPSTAMRKARSRAGSAVRAVVERAALLVYREHRHG
jgi:hypothetical protein